VRFGREVDEFANAVLLAERMKWTLEYTLDMDYTQQCAVLAVLDGHDKAQRDRMKRGENG
jgi:hypothetical protein